MKYFLFKYLFLGLFSFTSLAFSMEDNVSEEPSKYLYHQVQKINENFYVAKVPEQNFCLAMERVNERTQPLWFQYAKVQSSPCAVGIARHFEPEFTSAGSSYFEKVLELVSYFHNEIWVAYVTIAKDPQEIPENMRDYNIEDIYEEINDFAKDIQMFVTVTTTPNALVTSHMGVSASIEGILNNRKRGVSMELHSFAAKVMLMRNPNRRFMINSPTTAMAKIILNSLPAKTVYVGTKEMEELMKAPQNMAFALKKQASRNELENKDFKDMAKKTKSSDLVKMLHQEKFVISQKDIEKKLNFKLKYRKQSPFSDQPFRSTTRNIIEFMKKHPPILSVDGENCRSIKDCLTIFDPQNPGEPWLIIDRNNFESQANYQWIFCEPFQNWKDHTHYIAVELKALADSRPIG